MGCCMDTGTAARRRFEHKMHHSYLKCVLCTVIEETKFRDKRKSIWVSKGIRRRRKKIHAEYFNY